MPSEGSFHKLVRSKSRSDVLLVVFSHAADRPPKFSLYDTAIATGANVLFLNDELGSWYTGGIPSLGSTHSQVVMAIDSMATLCGATKIICLGASMGGYGAIRFARSLGAQSCLATDFEIRLGVLGSRSASMGGISYGSYMSDISQLVPDSAYLLHSKSDIFDVYSASLVPQESGANLFGVSSQKHASILKMKSEGVLDAVLSDLVSGIKPNLPYESSSWMQSRQYSDVFFMIHCLYESSAYLELNEYIDSLPSLIRDLPIVLFMQSMSLYRSGEISGAKDVMVRASSVAGEWSEPLSMLGVFSFRMGEDLLAIDYLRQSIDAGSVNSIVWNQLGDVYFKIKDYPSALDAYNQAGKINPGVVAYKKAIQRVTQLISKT